MTAEHEILKLSEEFKTYRYKTEKRFDTIEKKMSGMWWKMGVLAGILSIVVGQVFGTGIMAVLSPFLTGMGL